VKSRKDFEDMKWRYNPRSPGRYPVFWDDISRSLSNRDYPVSITFPSMFWRARDWTGLRGLSIMFHRDPELVHDMFSFWTDFVIEATRVALRTVDVDYVLRSDDMAYKGRAMVSPEIMRRFMLPLYRRWVDHFRGHGVEIIMMDSDGYIHEIAPGWAEAGINALCPMEIRAGNDLLKLRDELGHAMAFMGGIDKTKIAKGGKALEEEFESKVPQLLEDGGYIPCCDHYIPPNVSWSNYCRFIELLKEYCGWSSP
jgi:uroporphyrinogen-III decarboxylase